MLYLPYGTIRTDIKLEIYSCNTILPYRCTFSMCSFGVGQRRIYLGWLIPVEGYTPRSGALTARSVLYINWYVSLTACSGLYIWLWGFLISKTRAVRAATKHLSVSLHCRLWRILLGRIWIRISMSCPDWFLLIIRTNREPLIENQLFVCVIYSVFPDPSNGSERISNFLGLPYLDHSTFVVFYRYFTLLTYPG
jgi:hypothetical protein